VIAYLETMENAMGVEGVSFGKITLGVVYLCSPMVPFGKIGGGNY
jgi:hypothetical protein